MTADRTWLEKLGFELEDKGTTTPLWIVVDDCGGERPASLAEIVLWTYLTTPAAPVVPAEPVASISECEACFTPDVCQLRGKCDHYSAAVLRVAAPVAPAEPIAVRVEAIRTAIDKIVAGHPPRFSERDCELLGNGLAYIIREYPDKAEHARALLERMKPANVGIEPPERSARMTG